MNQFTFYAPTLFAYGDGQEAQAGALIRKFGGSKVLLVTGGGSIHRNGLYDAIVASLKAADLQWIELSGIQANPRSGKVYEGIELCRNENIDFLLAVGGGSVIDTAKTIGIGVPYEGDFWDFFCSKAVPTTSLPLGAVPTLPAAGSEGSDNSVVTLEEGDLKWPSAKTDAIRPTFSILCPGYTKSLPMYQTACGIVDMMTHVMERYFTNTKDVMITDELSEAVMRTIVHAATVVMQTPDDDAARGDLMWASMLAHNGLLSTGRDMDWASHQIEHELSAFYDCAHGAGLAVVFPAWMTYTMDHDIDRFVRFATTVFHCPLDAENPQNTAKAGIEALRAFFQSLAMPAYLEDIEHANVEDIPAMVAHRAQKPNGFPFGGFVKIHEADMEAILHLCKKP